MRSAGIDLGSRSIELVIMEDGKVLEQREAETGFDPIKEAGKLLNGAVYDRIIATGYGRNLFELSFDSPTVTEIKAHAVGAASLFPESDTVLDIGGQDSKTIRLDAGGRVVKFEMNDKCAAGTGKFLEIMARSLGFTLGEFGEGALAATGDLQVSSMCTVFAESEVTSLVARGENRRDIARGLHLSVVKRAAGMLKRVSAGDGPIVFSGGVAHNPCIVRLLEETLQREILVPDRPHMVGALGAAILASNTI